MEKNDKPRLWTRSFCTLCISNFLMSTAFYFLLPTLPVYFTDVMQAGGLQTGILLAMYTLSALIIRPFVGFTLDFFGRKTLYLGSFILFAIMFGLYGFATGLSLMLALRFIHGLTWGGVTTSGSTIIVDLIAPERRGEGLGIFGMGMTAAMAIGPAIGLYILSAYGYKTMFIASTALCMTGLITALTVKYPKFHRSVHNGGFRFSTLFERSSIIISLGMLILMIPYGGIISYIALYASQHHLGNAGTFFLIFAAGVAASRIASGKLFDSRGPDELIYTACFLYIAGFLLLSLVLTPSGFYLAALLLGISNGIVFPVFQAMVNNLVPIHRRGAANSTLFTALDLGIGLGMVSMGWIYELLNLSNVYLISTGVIVLALLMYHYFVKSSYSASLIEKNTLNRAA
jgi:MFS family permease